MVTTKVMPMIILVIDSIALVCLSWSRLASSLSMVWISKAQATLRSHEPVCAAVLRVLILSCSCSEVCRVMRSPFTLVDCCANCGHSRQGAVRIIRQRSSSGRIRSNFDRGSSSAPVQCLDSP